MMSIIGTIVVLLIVLQTMFAWFFHAVINKSDRPETFLEWMQWSCLYWTLKYFVNTGEDEDE